MSQPLSGESAIRLGAIRREDRSSEIRFSLRCDVDEASTKKIEALLQADADPVGATFRIELGHGLDDCHAGGSRHCGLGCRHLQGCQQLALLIKPAQLDGGAAQVHADHFPARGGCGGVMPVRRRRVRQGGCRVPRPGGTGAADRTGAIAAIGLRSAETAAAGSPRSLGCPPKPQC